jgi:uncharacterized protein with von Willebrand factor type A (vWA) domain
MVEASSLKASLMVSLRLSPTVSHKVNLMVSRRVNPKGNPMVNSPMEPLRGAVSPMGANPITGSRAASVRTPDSRLMGRIPAMGRVTGTLRVRLLMGRRLRVQRRIPRVRRRADCRTTLRERSAIWLGSSRG